jgi:hypothetical protein
MNIPAFKNDGHEAEYWHIFDHYKSRYLDCLQDVKEAMFPGYSYTQLSGPLVDCIRHVADEIIYAATDDFERAHPEYKGDDAGFYVRPGSLKDSMQEALKDFWHGDINDNGGKNNDNS